MPRKFSGFAIWVLLGLAIALAPLSCGSSDTTSPDTDSGPADMTQT